MLCVLIGQCSCSLVSWESGADAVCSDRAVLVLACKLESGADAVCSDRAEELLLEAHSTHEEHVWWVDLCFFVGFLGSFIMEKYSRS